MKATIRDWKEGVAIPSREGHLLIPKDTVLEVTQPDELSGMMFNCEVVWNGRKYHCMSIDFDFHN